MPKTARAAELTATMTLAEALEVAKGFEMAAYQFYLELAGRVDADTRLLVLELASEEQDHHRLLAEMAVDPHLGDHLGVTIATPPTHPGFDACARLPALSEHPFEDDVLGYAEAREQIAREHYGYLAEVAPIGPLQDLFRFLYTEEQRHLDRVSTRWSRMFSII